MDKKTLRKEMLKKRLSLSEGFIENASRKICNKIRRMEEYKNAKTVAIYFPIKNEVNVLPLLKDKTKKFLLPRLEKEKLVFAPFHSLQELKEGRFRIPEPISPKWKEKIDVVIVPALAFSPTKHRLGYGKGFYDKFLKKINPFKIGVCFDFQLRHFAHEEHDAVMDSVVTEKRVIV
ncbi:MAG: 5-formyltetrahydrofolate cyclo-ligase [Candidatus Anstonellales archaeon]